MLVLVFCVLDGVFPNQTLYMCGSIWLVLCIFKYCYTSTIASAVKLWTFCLYIILLSKCSHSFSPRPRPPAETAAAEVDGRGDSGGSSVDVSCYHCTVFRNTVLDCSISIDCAAKTNGLKSAIQKGDFCNSNQQHTQLDEIDSVYLTCSVHVIDLKN